MLEGDGVKILSVMLAGYLIGTFPSAYLLGKYKYGIDIRKYGSGNIGTMNTRLVMGWGPAVIILLVDMTKGAASAWLGNWAGIDPLYPVVLAVAGHIYPVWLGFGGGKGLATSLGGLLVAGQYTAVLVFVLLWIPSYFVVKTVDKGTVIAAAALLVYAIWMGPYYPLLALALLLLVKHLHSLKAA